MSSPNTQPTQHPRVIFVNRVFWPDEEATAQLLFDLASALAQDGTEVLIITASAGPSIWSGNQAESIRVIRVGRAARRRPGLREKMWGYLDFLRHARKALRQHVRPGDTVVFKTDPPMLGPCLGPVARGRGARVLHWAQDLYPEVAMALADSALLNPGFSLLRLWRNREWALSDAIVTLGSDMGEMVRRANISADRIQLAPNWAPRGLDFSHHSAQRAAWQVDPNQLLLCYSGNLGRAHNLTAVVDLAAALCPRPTVTLQIVGHGAQRATLESAARRQGLSNLHFADPVPRADLGAVLAAADLHLVTMRPECVGTVWPSKFYGIVAAHKPILFIGPRNSELYQLITTHHLGLALDPTEDLSHAVAWIEHLDSHREELECLVANVRRFEQQLPGLAGARRTWQSLLRQSPLPLDSHP